MATFFLDNGSNLAACILSHSIHRASPLFDVTTFEAAMGEFPFNMVLGAIGDAGGFGLLKAVVQH